MNVWIHTAILATTLAAAVAVGIASAATEPTLRDAAAIAQKADRLPLAPSAEGYVTVETRGDGVSVLRRVPVN